MTGSHFWVIGGEFGSMNFHKLVEGSAQVKGPFKTRKEAEEAAKREAEVRAKLAEEKDKLEEQLRLREEEYKRREAEVAARAEAEAIVERFEVKTTGVDAAAGLMSGGNAQKVLIARELDSADGEHEARVLVAASPTRGLDVGAIEAVWGILDRARDEPVHHIVMNLVPEALLDHRGRHLAGTKPRDARLLRVVARHARNLCVYQLAGDLDRDGLPCFADVAELCLHCLSA